MLEPNYVGIHKVYLQGTIHVDGYSFVKRKKSACLFVINLSSLFISA